ncbi:hypothetical protein BJV82DRAFT_674643 [Fennellomyces sp. T-0311]|nr:hypothetical protein BJV82DRAFT_674643 [Fennellomyces sp. T-0311]
MAEGYHRAPGGAMYLQLWHVGRATGWVLVPNNAQPVSASAIVVQRPNDYNYGSDFEVPHALSVEEIAETVQDYVKAAKNAIAAGFDGVEIHGANVFWLINSSTRPATSERIGMMAPLRIVRDSIQN